MHMSSTGSQGSDLLRQASVCGNVFPTQKNFIVASCRMSPNLKIGELRNQVVYLLLLQLEIGGGEIGEWRNWITIMINHMPRVYLESRWKKGLEFTRFEWNVSQDLQFDIGGVAVVIENSDPTKRSVVSATAKLFDPIGIVFPVTILFKIFAQRLCEAIVGWDEPLTGDLLREWEHLQQMLRGTISIVILRCIFPTVIHSTQSAKLIEFPH